MGRDEPIHPDPLLPGQLKHFPAPPKEKQVQTLVDKFWEQQYRANHSLLDHRCQLAQTEIMSQNDGMDMMDLAAKHGPGKRKKTLRDLQRSGYSDPSIAIEDGKKQHKESVAQMKKLNNYYKSKSSYADEMWFSPRQERAVFGTSNRSFPISIPGASEPTCGARVYVPEGVTGNNMVHAAAAQGQYAMMQTAVDTNTLETINAQNLLGDTPLHIACDMGSTAIIELLLNNGGDMSIKTVDGDTCVHRAVQSQHSTVVAQLAAKKADINAQNRYGHTPLHTAAANGDVECCKGLLYGNYGALTANLSLKDPRGHTALFAAAARGRVETARLLVDAKASVHSSDRDGNTVLHLAVGNGDVKLTSYLLEKRANLATRNLRKEAPIDTAYRNGQLPTLEWIFTKSTWRSPLREVMSTVRRLPLGGCNLNHEYKLPKGPRYAPFMERGAVPKDVGGGMRVTNLRVWPVLAAQSHVSSLMEPEPLEDLTHEA
jgi:ankyrin repeat protein